MNETIVVTSIERQFAGAWRTLRGAVANFPEDQWRAGDVDFLIPARLAFHLVQACDFHLNENPDEFDFHRFGINWEESEPGALLSQTDLLAYLDETKACVEARLRGLGDSGLLGPDRYPQLFASVLEHAIYALRHLHHHLGQINAELRRRGLERGKWR